MRDAAGESIEAPYTYRIKPPLVGIRHESVKLWPPVLRARNAFINVLASDLPAAPLAILPQLPRLHCHVLAVIRCTDPRINGDSHTALHALHITKRRR